MTRDFLDIFNRRLQMLMLPVWRKYRYHAMFTRGATDPFSEQLFALIGLHGQRIRETPELNWKRLLPYLGLLSLRAHSAALIESVLRYYFKHAQLFIEQCVERTVDVRSAQLNCLGVTNHQLGRAVVLGNRVPDRSGKFRVHVKGLDWERFHEFLPIGPGYRPLGALVRFTLRDPLTTTFVLSCAMKTSENCALANRTPVTWAGPPGSGASMPWVWSCSTDRYIKDDS